MSTIVLPNVETASLPASPKWARATLSSVHDQSTFYCGSVRIDLSTPVAWILGRPVGIRPLEQRLLGLLWKEANRVVSTESLVAALYGLLSLDSGRVRLKRLVADIRGRLGPEIASQLCTVPKRGLILYVDHTELAPHLA
jgi:DNA-binding response OmpR family regulator